MSTVKEALLLDREVESASPLTVFSSKNPENLEKNPFFVSPNT